MYGMCLSTPRFSAFIFDGSFLSNELLGLIRGQVRKRSTKLFRMLYFYDLIRFQQKNLILMKQLNYRFILVPF